ncbi:hypothetical protein A8C56_20970 [Niabella ginsenosidivorans]|uniref:DUF805 domain-containing protein n=1 Tax=Niabella ginsenosidivorans TaxID=1176587 RepID=A0A1A9I8W2_9BACT|nr:DUF805 domain-containing protein [Niabella ginsenosidivorans]ANH83121.1 hypothetical protein A8C56_20970 [Niabella ginsenosidivorans]
MKGYLSAFKNFANFNARAGRAEYWFFALFNALFAIIAIVLDVLFKTSFTSNGQSLVIGWVYTMYSLAVFVPGLALTIRRLHDSNKSGWYLLIPVVSVGTFYLCLAEALKKTGWLERTAFYGWALTAIIFLLSGMVVFAIVLLQKGTRGINRYGERLYHETKAYATQTLLLLLIIVEGISRVAVVAWSLADKKLSAMADKDYHHFREIQQNFMSLLNLFSLLSLVIFMGLPFLFKERKMRIILFVITGLIALSQLSYEYKLLVKAFGGE